MTQTNPEKGQNGSLPIFKEQLPGLLKAYAKCDFSYLCFYSYFDLLLWPQTHDWNAWVKNHDNGTNNSKREDFLGAFREHRDFSPSRSSLLQWGNTGQGVGGKSSLPCRADSLSGWLSEMQTTYMFFRENLWSDRTVICTTEEDGEYRNHGQVLWPSAKYPVVPKDISTNLKYVPERIKYG